MHVHTCTLPHPHVEYLHLCDSCGAKYVTRYDAHESPDSAQEDRSTT